MYVAMIKKTNSRIRRAFIDMHFRCNNPNSTSFEYYGGKGIVVCEEWDDFSEFEKWSYKNGFKANFVLHRKNSNDDYCPDNCEWMSKDKHLAARGSGKVLKVNINGEDITLSALAKQTGIHRETLKYRLLNNWSIEKLLDKPINTSRMKNVI